MGRISTVYRGARTSAANGVFAAPENVHNLSGSTKYKLTSMNQK